MELCCPSPYRSLQDPTKSGPCGLFDIISYYFFLLSHCPLSTLSTVASMHLLQHVRLVSASSLLCWLLPLPGRLYLLISSGLTPSLPSNLCSEVIFSIILKLLLNSTLLHTQTLGDYIYNYIYIFSKSLYICLRDENKLISYKYEKEMTNFRTIYGTGNQTLMTNEGTHFTCDQKASNGHLEERAVRFCTSPVCSCPAWLPGPCTSANTVMVRQFCFWPKKCSVTENCFSLA